jgi:hypothetical protein
MSALLSWVLAASTMLVPNGQHDVLASAIASRVEQEPPLFKNDADHLKTASLLVAMGFREATLKHDAVGDMRHGKPTSFCAFQIHLPWGSKTPEGWTGDDLLQDPDKCVTVALRMLRDSMRVCPAHPLAFYAEGPKGCASPRAQAISRDRLAIAQRLVRDVKVTEEEPVSMMWPLGSLKHGTW